MSKKQSKTIENSQRQSRKEVLIARKQEQQTRRVWIFVISVVALIIVVMMIGIINELVLKPSKPVATVGDVEITMKDWRDQVEYQRALLVSRLTDIADLVGGDVSQIQQIAQFELQALSDPETLGQQVLDEMIDDELIRQEAEARGLVVSDEEVQNALEERFLYFDGESPTPQPTPTETVMPTPSLTPISQATVTDTLDAPIPTPVALPGSTSTPLPTPTPISLESFQESLTTWYDRLGDYGINSAMFRDDIESSLYREWLIETLAEEATVSNEAEQVSIFYIRFDSEDEAAEVLTDIESSDYLTAWNTIKSRREEGETDSTSFSGELLWRTYDNLEGILGPDVRTASEVLDIGQPSSVIDVPSQSEDGVNSYYIILVSGREVRPLSQGAFDNAKQQNFMEWLETARQNGIVTFERWRANIPQRPILDTRNWIYPTPVPTATDGSPLEPALQPTP